MADTKQISDAVHRLFENSRAVLRQAHAGLEQSDCDAKQLNALGADVIKIVSITDGICYTARTILSDDDWNQFLYRTGLSAEAGEAAVQRVNQLINQQ